MARGFAHFTLMLCFAAAAMSLTHAAQAFVSTQPITPETPTDTMVWPTLTEASPSEATPGETITITGHGGYVRTEDGGYDESYRTFGLFFDGQPVSTLGCYVNQCQGTLTVPATTEPGWHQISTEGGASLQILVKANYRMFLPIAE